MNRFSKLATALAVVPVLAITGTAFAESPGQLTGGSNTFLVKNLTQKGVYANSITAACSEQVQYSIRLHNAAFGGLTNVQVSANIMSGKMTAVPAEGASQGTTGNATVSMPSNGSIAYESGSTVLYDVNGNVIRTLPDGITTQGVNVGNIKGSTTEFVNFKAKVACPPVTPPPAPVSKFECKALDVNQIDRTRFDFTARASAENAVIQSYTFTVKNSAGATVDTKTVNTSATSAVYNFNQSTPSTYTISVVVKTDKGNTQEVAVCSKQITVKEQPTTPVVQGKTTEELPNTGAGSLLSLFAGASAAGAAGHYALRRFRG